MQNRVSTADNVNLTVSSSSVKSQKKYEVEGSALNIESKWMIMWINFPVCSAIEVPKKKQLSLFKRK